MPKRRFLKKTAGQPNLIQVFSARQSGNLKVKEVINANKNLDHFLSGLGIEKTNLVMMKQIHGNKIKVATREDGGKVIKNADGLVTQSKKLFLGVNTADCLPISFCDPQKKIVGIAHAGWRGILLRIAPKVVKSMEKLGADPGKMFVCIGPHIGSCCYLVGNDLVKKFQKEFGNLPKMVHQDKNGTYLSLTTPVSAQLIKSGIKKENIEISPDCTSCQNGQFFSFRKDSRKTYGEMLGVIGWN
ncbi:MAG TPA: peptidoglycan editing factor PgeF [Candidatus Bathyarchaeia archaeon]|nr:peptidoglycan editing factor PgeF [Candidatus Bathyarchaeia archaeon]